MNFLKKINTILVRSFYHLGKFIGTHPGYFILIPIFLSLICATGFQRIVYQDDVEYLFTPSNGLSRKERSVVEQWFKINFTSDFNPTRTTRQGRFAHFIITAKDEGSILKADIWEEIITLNQIIHNIELVVDGEVKKSYQYDDLCAKTPNGCFENKILFINQVMPEIQNNSYSLSYPTIDIEDGSEQVHLPFIFGGVDLSVNNTINSVKALFLQYYLRTNNRYEDKRGIDWEKLVLERMKKEKFEMINVAWFTSITLETDLEENAQSVHPYFAATIIVMTVFCICSTTSIDSVRAKPWLGAAGILSSVLACVASFGFLIYIGVEFIGINMAAPFLMLGIGMDDTFVMLAAWRSTKLQDSVPERMAHTFADAAVSITITSITDMLSFYLGMTTPFPSIKIFCLYTGTAVLVTYMWHITFFGGCLALAGHLEKRNRHGLCFFKVKPLSESKDLSKKYKIFCSGGISQTDPFNPVDNQPHSVMVFFRDHFANFINNPISKISIILLFFVYISVAIYGCTQVREGLEKHKLSRDDSHSVIFYNTQDRYFNDYKYRVQAVVSGDLDYSNTTTQDNLLTLVKEFENSYYVAGSNYTEFWLKIWLEVLKQVSDIAGEDALGGEESFISNIVKFVDGEFNYYFGMFGKDLTPLIDMIKQDVVFNENRTNITASRFIIQIYNIKDSKDDTAMMEDLRTIAKNSKFNVTVFHQLFLFFDQFAIVRITSIQAISLAAFVMIIVSLILIPNPICSLWIGLSIASIEIGVIGFMTFWSVNLDTISMINLIMCIGFSVDFTAHIAYAYLTAKVDTPEERVQECLYYLGLPILQASVSTILGIFSLVLAPSYIYKTFFKTIFLVIFIGALHGLFLLPVLLSLFGPGSCSKKNIDPQPDDDTKSIDPSGTPMSVTRVGAVNPDISLDSDINQNGKCMTSVT